MSYKYSKAVNSQGLPAFNKPTIIGPPDAKPHEVIMYADLRAGGDTHSEALGTIKGERLYLALQRARARE